MAENQIKLAVVFSEDGAVKGVEEITKQITKLTTTATTATEALKKMQSELRKQTAVSQSPLPRNVEEFRQRGGSSFTSEIARNQAQETQRMIGETKAMSAAAAKGMVSELRDAQRLVMAAYGEEMKRGFFTIGNESEIRQFMTPLFAKAKEAGEGLSKKLKEQIGKAMWQIAKSINDEMQSALMGNAIFSQLGPNFSAAHTDTVQAQAIRFVQQTVKTQLRSAIGDGFNFIGPLQKTVSDEIVDQIKANFTGANFSHGIMWSEIAGAVATGMKKLNLFPSPQEIQAELTRQIMAGYSQRGSSVASPSEIATANRYRQQMAGFFPTGANAGPVRPVGHVPELNIKVANEGPIKNSASALMKWRDAALSAAGAAKSGEGSMSGFGRAIGSMNLNALFHGFLNIPNRISFAWWKLNNMFFLVSQGVNIVSGAFKGLTAGLMASNELFEMHRRLGYSITFLQQMQIAAKMTDSSLANLQVTLKNLSIAVGTAQKQAPTPQRTALLRLQDYLGPDKVKEIFKDVPGAGTDIMENFAKSTNKGELALHLLQEALVKSRQELDKTGQTALSSGEKLEIFTALGGRGAFATLLPVLEKMSDVDFTKVMDQMQSMGVLLGKNEEEALANAEAAEKFRETWAQVANLPLGAITQFDIGAAPGLTASLERVRDLVREINLGGGGLKDLGQRFGNAVFIAVDKVSDRLREFIVDFKNLGGQEAFGSLAEDIGKYFGETIPAIAGRIIPAIADVASRAAKGFIEGLKTAISSDSISAIFIGAISGIALGDTFEQLARGGSAAKFLGPLAPLLGTALGGAITGALAGAIANAAANNQVKELGIKVGKLLGDSISSGLKILFNLADLSSGLIPQAIKIGKDLASGILTGINQSLRENFGTNLAKTISGAIFAINIASLLSKAFTAAFAAVQFIGLQAGLSATVNTALTAGLLPTIQLAGRFIGQAFILAFTNPLVGLGVAVAAYIYGSAAVWAEASKATGHSSGQAWRDGFILAIADVGDQIANLIGKFSDASRSVAAKAAAGLSGGDEERAKEIAGGTTTATDLFFKKPVEWGASLLRMFTSVDEKTIETKKNLDNVAENKAKEGLDKTAVAADQTRQKLEDLAKPLGLIVNPNLSEEGKNRLTTQFAEIQDLNKRKRELVFDMQAAIDSGDKTAVDALDKQLKETEGKVDAITRKAMAAKDLASNPEGESIQQETERRRKEQADALAAQRRAEAEARKDANARLKIAQQVEAAFQVSSALAASPGFDSLAKNMIVAEAAAQGITKGLNDSVVQAGLLSVAITKKLEAAAKTSNDRHLEIQGDKQRLEIIDQQVAAGKSYEEAELRASAVKESQIPLYEQLRDLVSEKEEGVKRETDLLAIENGIARERINIEDEITNKIKERENAARQAQQTSANDLQRSRAVANGALSPDQARVDKAAEGAVSAEEARLKRLTEAQNIAAENASRGVIKVADTLKDSLGQVFDGLIDGTKNFSDIFNDIGKQWGRKLFNSILDEKIGFDANVKGNFLGLAQYATDAFGKIFDSVGFEGIGDKIRAIPDAVGKTFGTAGYRSSDAYVNDLTNGGSSGGINIDLNGGNNSGGFGQQPSFNYGNSGGSSGDGGGLFGGVNAGDALNYGQQGYNYFFGGSSAGAGAIGSGGGVAFEYGGSAAGVPFEFGSEAAATEAASGAAGVGDAGANSAAGAGGGAAGAVAGAIGGFQTANMLGNMIFVKGSTGLEGLAQRGAEGNINSNAKIINDVIGTVLGAVFSMFLGPFGGIVGGAVASAVGASVVGSIDRDTLRTRDYTGGLGRIAEYVEGPLGPGPGIIFKLLGIPTLGTAMRRGGESILDSTDIFGNKGFQGKYGDFIRDTGKVNINGKSEKVDDNYRTGGDTAIARGMTREQVDRIQGATGILYSQIAKKEKFPEDAGRLLEDMGNGMAELISRGMAEGLTFDEIKVSMRELAKELGVDLNTAIKGLPLLLRQTSASAKEFGKLDDFASWKAGADQYAKAILGIDTIFSQDLPTGVNIAAIALQSLERDGVKALGNLTGKSSDFYTAIANNSELFQQVVSDLVAQGYEVNSEEIINRVKDISASATAVASTLASVFDGQDVNAGIAGLATNIKDEVGKAAKEALTTELLKDTNIGATFEKAFSVVRKLKDGDFNLSKEGGVKEFARQLREGIVEGQKQLLEYAPLLKQLREQFDEAMKLDTPEEFAADLIVKTEEALTSLKSSAADAFGNALEAPTVGAAMITFATDMSKNVRTMLVDAIKSAFSENAIISETLAKSIAMFRQGVTKAMEDGFLDPTEVINLRALFISATKTAQTATQQLLPMIRSTMEIIDNTSEGIALRVAALREALTGGAKSGFESFIAEVENKESKKAPAQAFADSIYETVRKSLLSAIVDAFTQAALMEGILAPLMDGVSTTLKEALKDKVITPEEQASIRESIRGVGAALRDSMSWLGPLLEQFGIVINDVEGLKAPNVKGGNITAKNGDLQRTDKPTKGNPVYDEWLAMSEQERVIFEVVMNQLGLNFQEAADQVEHISDIFKERGIKIDQALSALAESAVAQGIKINEAAEKAFNFMNSLPNRGDFSGAKLKDLNQDSSKIFAWLQAQRPEQNRERFIRRDVEQSVQLDAVIDKAGISFQYAFGRIVEIMQTKGLNMQQAIDYFIASVASGGEAARAQADSERRANEQRDKALDDEKAITAQHHAYLLGLAKNQGANGDQQQAIDKALLEREQNLREQGYTEKEIRDQMARDWENSGKDFSQFLADLASKNAASANEANTANHDLATASNTAAVAVDALGRASYAAAYAIADGKKNNGGKSGPAAAATGGTFVTGSAVVGEAGKPELVNALPGGGFEVIPLEWKQAHALLNGGVDGFMNGGCKGPGCTKGCAGGCKVKGMALGGVMGADTQGREFPGGPQPTGGTRTTTHPPRPLNPGSRGTGPGGNMGGKKAPGYSPNTACGFSIDGTSGWYPARGGKKDPDGFDKACGSVTEWKQWAPGKWAAKVSNSAGCCQAQRDPTSRTKAETEDENSMFGSIFGQVFGAAVEKVYGIKVASYYKNPAERAKEAASGGGGGGGGDSGGGGGGGGGDYGDTPSGLKSTCGLTGTKCGGDYDCEQYDHGKPLMVNGCLAYNWCMKKDTRENYDSSMVFNPNCQQEKDKGPKAAATGGMFGQHGRAVVGEAGAPELVEALPGGGFRVTPLSWDQASRMLNGNTRGMASGGVVNAATNGGAIIGPPDQRPTTPPPPPPPPPPPTHGGNPGTRPQDLFGGTNGGGKAFADELVKGLKDELPGGLASAIQDAFENSAVVKAMNDAVDAILDQANQTTTDMLAGTITPEDAAKKIEDLANQADAEIEKVRKQAEMLGPLFEKIAKKKALTFNVDISSALKDLAQSGDMKAFGKSLNEVVYNSIIDAVIGALLASGPLKDALDEFNTQLSSTMEEAMKDGQLSKAEADMLADLATKFGEKASGIMEMLKPFFDELGIRLGNSAKDGVQAYKDALNTAADAGFRKGPKGAFDERDDKGNIIPDKSDYSKFIRELKIAIYQNIRQALIQAFIESVMTQGVIGLMMTKILGLIDRYIEASADRREKILAKIIEKSRIIADAFKDLEPIFKEWAGIFESLAGIFSVPMEELQNTSDNVSDATKDGCNGACELEKRKQTLELGLAELNQLGRAGTVKAEVFVPHEVSGANRDAANQQATDNATSGTGHAKDYDPPMKDPDKDKWGNKKDDTDDKWGAKRGTGTGRGWGTGGGSGGEGKSPDGKEDWNGKGGKWGNELKDSTDSNSTATKDNTTAANNNTAALNSATTELKNNTSALISLSTNIASLITSKQSKATQRHFASGGLVNGPTNSLIGEAGPEAIIPLSDKRAAMKIGNAILDGMGINGTITNVSDFIKSTGTGSINNNQDTSEEARKTNNLLRELISAVKSNSDVSIELNDEKLMRGIRKASRATTKSGRNVF